MMRIKTVRLPKSSRRHNLLSTRELGITLNQMLSHSCVCVCIPALNGPLQRRHFDFDLHLRSILCKALHNAHAFIMILHILVEYLMYVANVPVFVSVCPLTM